VEANLIKKKKSNKKQKKNKTDLSQIKKLDFFFLNYEFVHNIRTNNCRLEKNNILTAESLCIFDGRREKKLSE
jgi:hypothetical protein